MTRLTNTLINTICHIIIDGQAQEKFYLITHLIMLLQTIACVADPDSVLFKMVQWADPSTYLDPAFSIILCLLIIIIFSLFIIIKLIITEPDEMLVKPNTLKIYMGNILLHMQMLCKTSVLAPLIRATIVVVQSPDSSNSKVAGIVALSIYLAFLLPLSLYNTSNTFILTPQLNKKLTYINIYLLLNIFRIPFAILAPISQPGLIAVATLFFIVFISISVKQPIFAYSHQRPLKGMISAVAFTCLMRLCQAFQSGAQQSILLQLVGMISFICLIDWVSQFRVRKILQLPRPTVHQIKILVFLISNIKEYFEKLQYFIIRHHRRCCNPECTCSSVISHISSKGSIQGQYDDIIWYRFLIDYIQQFYNLAEMQTLAESEMRLRIEKYQYIVIDLAEMYLFKLGHVNEAYYIVNNYRHLLETRGINFLSFRQKKKIINYYLQENISIKYHTEGVINLNADSYMNFQIAFDKYRKILLRTAKSTGGLWQQMGKREPDGEKIEKLVHILEKWHTKIRQMYQDITSSFEKSAEILEVITKDYYENVLNISVKSPFHVIETPKFQNILAKSQEKVEKISENMQAFSFNSETPMCFVAVDQEKFGQIMGCNSHFNKVMNLEFGRLAKIDEFMVPEMRNSHGERMKEFIRGDTFNLQHKNGFTINLRGKIVYTKILVQIMPSIIQGLRYVFFLKKLMPRKKILGLKNYQAIGYTSQSFDDTFQGRGKRDLILRTLQEDDIASLKQKQEIKIQFQEREIFIRYMHEFTENDTSWLFIEFYEKEDVLLETKYNLMGERTNDISNFKKTSDSRTKRKDSVISRDSGYELEKSNNMQKSDLQEKMAAEKLKKTEEGIKLAYEIVIDDRKKTITYRILTFTILIVLLLFGILIATVLVKLSNQNMYLNTLSINTAFNKFMMTVSKDVYFMKIVNFYQFSNNTFLANYFFGILASNINITSNMDQLVVNFDINSITQTWNTYTCGTNSSWIVATQNNFLTVSDFIQNPITNLVVQPVANFKFPPNLAAQTFPLASTQCLYFQFITNTLYVSIPGFLKLKTTVMDKILLKSVGVSLPMILLFVAVMLVSVMYVLGKVKYNKCVTMLKNDTYQLFQSLQRGLIAEKEKNCKEFINKYTLNGTDEKIDDFNPMASEHSGSFKLEGEENMTHSKVERTIDEHTERELEVTPQAKSQTKTSNFIANQKEGRKIKASYIFKKKSIYWIVIKYSLIAFPFFLFAVIFGSLEHQQTTNMTNAIQIQSNIQILQQNVGLIINYAMQHGTEDNQYSSQLHLPNYLTSLVSQIYEIQRIFVSQSLDFSNMPKVKAFLDEIAYSNLCQIPDVKYQASLIARCPTVSQGVLTKGFYSSLISFLEELNTLMIAYPTTSNLTQAQRMVYLGNPLFTSNAVILYYFDTIIEQFLVYFIQDFKNMIQKTTNVLLYASIGIIIGVGFVEFLFELHFIRVIKREILEIKSLFLLISYESIMKDEALKAKFYGKVEQFKKLK